MRSTTLRFTTALLVTGAGVALGVGAFVFDAGTERWLGLGAGAAVLTVVLLVTPTTGRGAFQRWVDAVLIPTAAWTIVSARAVELDGAGLTKWLSLAAGAAIAGLGLISLVAHEFAVESDLRWARRRLSEHATFGDLVRGSLPAVGTAVRAGGAPSLQDDVAPALPNGSAGHPEPHATEWHP